VFGTEAEVLAPDPAGLIIFAGGCNSSAMLKISFSGVFDAVSVVFDGEVSFVPSRAAVAKLSVTIAPAGHASLASANWNGTIHKIVFEKRINFSCSF
jgi:hypothetical protein